MDFQRSRNYSLYRNKQHCRKPISHLLPGDRRATLSRLRNENKDRKSVRQFGVAESATSTREIRSTAQLVKIPYVQIGSIKGELQLGLIIYKLIVGLCFAISLSR